MSKVLVVDDEAISVVTIGAFLREEGFEVEIAGSAREALGKAANFHPDLLVSDWKLKDDLDGIEVARNLQKGNPALKAILYSGLGVDDLRRQARGLNVFRFLEKPCGLADLLEAVSAALRPKANSTAGDTPSK